MSRAGPDSYKWRDEIQVVNDGADQRGGRAASLPPWWASIPVNLFKICLNDMLFVSVEPYGVKH